MFQSFAMLCFGSVLLSILQHTVVVYRYKHAKRRFVEKLHLPDRRCPCPPLTAGPPKL